MHARSLWALLVAALGWLSLTGCGQPKTVAPDREESDAEAGHLKAAAMTESHAPERLARIGPQACVECHDYEVEQWEKSDHAHANRPASEAFFPAFASGGRLVEGDENSRLRLVGRQMVLEILRDSEVSPDSAAAEWQRSPINGILARRPLWQGLVPFPGGRWQVTSVAYDPAEKEWFEVFENEGRFPGEWGHWTGQGMNWNANCAYCHMTDYHKNLSDDTLAYESTWLQHGISCAQCHTGLETHVREARAGNPTAGLSTRTPEQIVQTCATCHSHRNALTEEAFEPGDRYDDHFTLSLPDQPGLYYPDGQIRDEVFVYGSFEMSRMAHAGITCADCHLPHSQEVMLSVQNNMLCQRCHESGLDDAPIIEPLEHSHHAAGSTGNTCVECHMPHTVYMQRDPRRDHGFHSPDPLMTRELGIPNACSNCHQDQSLDWAIEWAERWYGEKLEASPQRARARALHAAYEGAPEGGEALRTLLEGEEIPVWRATYLGLLERYLAEGDTSDRLHAHLDAESPWERQRAVDSLARHPQGLEWIRPLMDDPSRTVRIAVAQAFAARGEPLPDGTQIARDWDTYLRFNADRPQSLFFLAQEALREGQPRSAYDFLDRAIELDYANPGVYGEAAVLASQAGDA
ncbi:MAG: ammonia-forming cytochrome c nitrite reductase subunit c552, partial [Verrucomicrobiota bacterium]